MTRLIVALVLACLMGASCGPIVREPPNDDKSLIVASCPARPKLEGQTFGDWTTMAFTLAGMYDECSAAALGRVIKSNESAKQ